MKLCRNPIIKNSPQIVFNNSPLSIVKNLKTSKPSNLLNNFTKKFYLKYPRSQFSTILHHKWKLSDSFSLQIHNFFANKASLKSLWWQKYDESFLIIKPIKLPILLSFIWFSYQSIFTMTNQKIDWTEIRSSIVHRRKNIKSSLWLWILTFNLWYNARRQWIFFCAGKICDIPQQLTTSLLQRLNITRSWIKSDLFRLKNHFGSLLF